MRMYSDISSRRSRVKVQSVNPRSFHRSSLSDPLNQENSNFLYCRVLPLSRRQVAVILPLPRSGLREFFLVYECRRLNPRGMDHYRITTTVLKIKDRERLQSRKRKKVEHRERAGAIFASRVPPWMKQSCRLLRVNDSLSTFLQTNPGINFLLLSRRRIDSKVLLSSTYLNTTGCCSISFLQRLL